MEWTLFLNLPTTFASLLCGFAFGFLLRKATVSRFDTIVGQLLLRDFTVMKVILTAIVTGSIGIYSLSALGLIPTFHLSKTPLLFALLGGSIFGVGMSVAGYCPGTAIAALADGAKEMIWGVCGMIVGTLLFNEFSSLFMPYLNQKDALFQKTILNLFSIPDWAVIASLVAVWVAFAVGVRKLEKRHLPIARSKC